MVSEYLSVYLPVWLVGPVMFLGVTILFYVLGRFLVKPVTAKIVLRSETLGDHIAKPLSRTLLYLIVILGIAVGLVAAGYRDLFTILGAMMAAASFAIGFAMKDTLGALIAGVSIFFDKPFRIGDKIEWDEFSGTVRDIRIRTTKVETYDGEMLTVPNDKITNEVVKNLSILEQRRHSITVGIGYGDDVEQAKYLIHGTVSDIEGILDDPKPSVHIDNLGDTTVDIQLRFWVARDEQRSVLDIKDELYKRVKDVFAEKGIDMPFPTYTIAGESIRLEKE